MAAVTICSDFGAQKIKSVTFSTVSPSICHEVMGPDAMILVFWMLSFKPTFSPSSHQEAFEFLFTFCHKGGVICISEVIDISPSNLDSSCASSSLAFRMMYSAYKLNTQVDDIQHWCTPFPIWNVCCSMSSSNLLLTCVQISQEVFDLYFTTAKNEMKNKSSSNIRYNMDEPWKCHAKGNKPVTKEQVLCDSIQACAPVVPTLLQSRGLYPASLLYPWDYSGRNTGMCCHFLIHPLRWGIENRPRYRKWDWVSRGWAAEVGHTAGGAEFLFGVMTRFWK